MFKKTAAAYDLAQRFIQQGDARNARLAMDIGDRFQDLAKQAATLPNRRLGPQISPQGQKAREAQRIIELAQQIDGPPENAALLAALLVSISDNISKLK